MGLTCISVSPDSSALTNFHKKLTIDLDLRTKD